MTEETLDNTDASNESERCDTKAVDHPDHYNEHPSGVFEMWNRSAGEG